MTESTKIVAIVNVTEDSFSDGGLFLESEAAIAHARALADDGADWTELGPASSHPDAKAVSAQEQIRRLAPVIDALRAGPLPLSVDATRSEVLSWAIDVGVGMVNDVRGFPDPVVRERLASSTAKAVVVHSLLGEERARREQASADAVLASIDRFFDRRLHELVAAGVDESRLIVDPGMGFFLSSDPKASIAVLRGLRGLRARFGRPVFVSVSRKSFLRALTGRGVEEIEAATLAAELFAVRQGADYVRTHGVRALRDGIAIEAALTS